MAKDWSKSEVEAIVEDYFNMFKLELEEQKFNKTEHRRALKEHLDNRSDSAVEQKHQNISAALNDMGMPCIEGYKPRQNYQRTLLPIVIEDYLKNNHEIQLLIQNDLKKAPEIPTVYDFLAAMDNPPIPEERRESTSAPPLVNPTGINYLEREAQKQSLGEAGEQFVISFEKARLIHIGKEFLADRIEQVSVTVGPSAGFDIRSFEPNGSDRFIEVKTTKYSKYTPFFVTPNELTFSQKNAARYFLYRVFKFRKEPRIFTLNGNLEDTCTLKPSQFVARTA